jgi:hypothetical protein
LEYCFGGYHGHSGISGAACHPILKKTSNVTGTTRIAANVAKLPEQAKKATGANWMVELTRCRSHPDNSRCSFWVALKRSADNTHCQSGGRAAIH